MVFSSQRYHRNIRQTVRQFRDSNAEHCPEVKNGSHWDLGFALRFALKTRIPQGLTQRIFVVGWIAVSNAFLTPHRQRFTDLSSSNYHEYNLVSHHSPGQHEIIDQDLGHGVRIFKDSERVILSRHHSFVIWIRT